RPQGGGLRPQTEHAPGRGGGARDGDRLPERRRRQLRAASRSGSAAEWSAHRSRQGARAEPRGMASQADIERRYRVVREAAARDGLDAVVVCGSEYTGFEGAVRYLSGFRILHRYAYVVLPLEGEPAVVFPREARWVGDHSESWIEDSIFAE